MRPVLARHVQQRLTDVSGGLKFEGRSVLPSEGPREQAMVGQLDECPVSRVNGWPGRSKPRGVSRMAQRRRHYRPSPPLPQGADNDLPEMSARPGQAVRL